MESSVTTREESQIFIQLFFKIVLYWCLGLIRHNIGTPLKHNKYIFDIPIPFCHNLYLSATFKHFLTEFAGFEILFHVVYMLERTKFLMCELIGQFDQSDRTCSFHM
jgi:hypothetical protein